MKNIVITLPGAKLCRPTLNISSLFSKQAPPHMTAFTNCNGPRSPRGQQVQKQVTSSGTVRWLLIPDSEQLNSSEVHQTTRALADPLHCFKPWKLLTFHGRRRQLEQSKYAGMHKFTNHASSTDLQPSSVQFSLHNILPVYAERGVNGVECSQPEPYHTPTTDRPLGIWVSEKVFESH